MDYKSRQKWSDNMLKIAIIADYYDDEYLGGAELTTKALLDRAPTSDISIKRFKSLEVNEKTIMDHMDWFFILTNFAHLKYTLLPLIAKTLNYAVIEYDYKFCMHRSIEVHKQQEGFECDCEDYFGQNIADFFMGSRMIFWMSEKQRDIYWLRFSRLMSKNDQILSSIFSREEIQLLAGLRNQSKDRKGWAYQASGTWLKGIENAEKYCKEKGLEAKPLLKMEHDKFLKEIASSEGFIFLPNAGDSCPRITIEAKLAGCKLHINDNVQHGGEEWFNKSIPEIEAYLDQAPDRFWKKIISTQEKMEEVNHG